MSREKAGAAGARPRGSMAEYEKKKNRHTLTRLIKYFRFFPGLTAAALGLALVSNLATTIQPYILAKIIDDNLDAGANDFNLIVVWALIYLLVVVLNVAAGFFQTIALASLGQRVMHKMRTELFAKVQSMSMTFFDKNASGSILTRVSSDVESMSELFSDVFVHFIRDVLLIVNVIVLMVLLSPKMTLYSLVIIPVVFLIAVAYRWFARRNFIKVKAQLSQMNGFLAENIIGMKVVQMFGMESFKNDEYRGMTRNYYKLGMTDMLLRSLSNPLLTLVGNIAVGLLVVIFAGDVLAGTLLVGVLYAFTSYVRQFVSPVSRIAEQFTNIQSSLISAERIFDIMDNDEDGEDMKAGIMPEKIRGDIEFRNVWFAYNDEHWVLRDVSFTIKSGQTIAVVGNTGSGKTTLISLLARFYEIQKGDIFLDGINLKEYNLTALRRAVSVVMQDVFLFTGDIRYNVRLNEERITDEDVDRAIETACAKDFIMALPQGPGSDVTERGGRFSAGERQLIAFARAVAFDASIMVLDEATANIDTQTESLLQDALSSVSRDKTTIIIAHRISTVMGSDNILVMEDGMLREQGTHHELLGRGGIYARLCSHAAAVRDNTAD